MHPTTAFPTTVDESGLGVREAIAADERPEPTVEFAIGSDRSVLAAERPNSERDDAPADACASADSAASVAGSSTISVAIPAYNEAETIAEVVVETREYAEEVVVIDDGSADDTAARAYDAGATVIEHDHNEGYGAALRTAFETADRRGVDHLVVLDGDGQHDPADIPRLVARQAETDAEIVIGSRFVDGYESAIPSVRRFGIQVVNHSPTSA
jgi:cellulose synthase/poly-beta-1,6-N-acetylglucosamine synthase-like glycosyltransferase